MATSSFKIMDPQRLEAKTFGFLIIFDGGTSHLTAYPCKSTSTLEVIAKIREWMVTFQMNPKSISADMALHRPDDMQSFHRMHKVKKILTGPSYTMAEPSTDGVRLQSSMQGNITNRLSRTS